jgi:hypothetical protein
VTAVADDYDGLIIEELTEEEYEREKTENVVLTALPL